MRRKIQNTLLALGLFTAVLVAAARPMAAQSQYELIVRNNSGYAIYKLQMSPSYSNSWGRDLLGSYVLTVGRTFTVTNITPGLWDIRVIDQDGDSCIIYGVAVRSDLSWNLTPAELLGCELH